MDASCSRRPGWVPVSALRRPTRRRLVAVVIGWIGSLTRLPYRPDGGLDPRPLLGGRAMPDPAAEPRRPAHRRDRTRPDLRPVREVIDAARADHPTEEIPVVDGDHLLLSHVGVDELAAETRQLNQPAVGGGAPDPGPPTEPHAPILARAPRLFRVEFIGPQPRRPVPGWSGHVRIQPLGGELA